MSWVLYFREDFYGVVDEGVGVDSFGTQNMVVDDADPALLVERRPAFHTVDRLSSRPCLAGEVHCLEACGVLRSRLAHSIDAVSGLPMRAVMTPRTAVTPAITPDQASAFAVATSVTVVQLATSAVPNTATNVRTHRSAMSLSAALLTMISLGVELVGGSGADLAVLYEPMLSLKPADPMVGDGAVSAVGEHTERCELHLDDLDALDSRVALVER